MTKFTTSPDGDTPKGRTWVEPEDGMPAKPWHFKDNEGLEWNLILRCPYCDDIMIEASDWAAVDWALMFCDNCGCQVSWQDAYSQWVAEIED